VFHDTVTALADCHANTRFLASRVERSQKGAPSASVGVVFPRRPMTIVPLIPLSRHSLAWRWDPPSRLRSRPARRAEGRGAISS